MGVAPSLFLANTSLTSSEVLVLLISSINNRYLVRLLTTLKNQLQLQQIDQENI